MNGSEASRKVDEPGLLKLYEELTGSSESQARNVFMYLCDRDDENSGLSDETSSPESSPWPEPRQAFSTPQPETITRRSSLILPQPMVQH